MTEPSHPENIHQGSFKNIMVITNLISPLYAVGKKRQKIAKIVIKSNKYIITTTKGEKKNQKIKLDSTWNASIQLSPSSYHISLSHLGVPPVVGGPRLLLGTYLFDVLVPFNVLL